MRTERAEVCAAGTTGIGAVGAAGVGIDAVGSHNRAQLRTVSASVRGY
jgi:hypothetical protein